MSAEVLAGIPAHVLHARVFDQYIRSDEEDTGIDTLTGVPTTARRTPSAWTGWDNDGEYGWIFAESNGPLRDGTSRARKTIEQNVDTLLVESTPVVCVSKLEHIDTAALLSKQRRVIIEVDVQDPGAKLTALLSRNKPLHTTDVVARGKYLSASTLRWLVVNGWSPREWVIDAIVGAGDDPLAGATTYIHLPDLCYLRIGPRGRVGSPVELFELVKKKYAPRLKGILDSRGVQMSL